MPKKRYSSSRIYIPKSPTRSVMHDQGAKIVAKDAVEFLISYLQKEVVTITLRARELAKHARRKKITSNDIDLAIKGL